MEVDWGINLDIAEYCRELNDVNIERRPMDERYFVKRYKLGIIFSLMLSLVGLSHAVYVLIHFLFI